jgi:hypothetical protein
MILRLKPGYKERFLMNWTLANNLEGRRCASEAICECGNLRSEKGYYLQ